MKKKENNRYFSKTRKYYTQYEDSKRRDYIGVFQHSEHGVKPVSDYTLALRLYWNLIRRKKPNLKFSELYFD